LEAGELGKAVVDLAEDSGIGLGELGL